MYKMLVLDLDDTLLSDDLTISEENIEAIKKAKEKGIYILFCSGRSNDSILKYIEGMDIHDDHEYFVSFNGGRIDTIDGENVFLRNIQSPILTELIELGQFYELTTQLYDEGKLIVEEETEYSKLYQSHTSMELKVMPDILSLKQSIKVLYNSSNKELLRELQAIIMERFEGEVEAFFSKPNYLEVLNIEANKGLAVKFMAEKLGIKREEVVTVGDGYNDKHMIEYAGLGVAVKNGRSGLKEVADYITERTNDESAVAEVINKFILS